MLRKDLDKVWIASIEKSSIKKERGVSEGGRKTRRGFERKEKKWRRIFWF